jgi:hypothetical protein
MFELTVVLIPGIRSEATPWGRTPLRPGCLEGTSPIGAAPRFRLMCESQPDPVVGPASLPRAWRYCPGRPSHIRIDRRRRPGDPARDTNCGTPSI